MDKKVEESSEDSSEDEKVHVKNVSFIQRQVIIFLIVEILMHLFGDTNFKFYIIVLFVSYRVAKKNLEFGKFEKKTGILNKITKF